MKARTKKVGGPYHHLRVKKVVTTTGERKRASQGNRIDGRSTLSKEETMANVWRDYFF